jgi:hypothetical protein
MWSSRMTVSNCGKVVIASKSTRVMQSPKASWIHLKVSLMNSSRHQY